MPIYEYQCDQCGRIDEALQKISDRPLTTCAHCAGKLKRLISHSAFHLKGTGWYVTDYAGRRQNETDRKKKVRRKKRADVRYAAKTDSRQVRRLSGSAD